MTLSTIYFKDFEKLKAHLKAHKKTLYVSSQTSTVLPFQFISDYLRKNEYYLGNLSSLPSDIAFVENNQLKVSGGVTWKEALEFCRSCGRDMMSWPTDETANVLAGLATSATGERSFAFGTLRHQVEKITYLNYSGEEVDLFSNKKLIDHPLFKNFEKELLAYQEKFIPYKNMKNGPFPRLEHETDLMIGFEGQLGVVKEAIFKTIPLKETKFLLIPLIKWEKDIKAHLEIFKKVQSFRSQIYSCEFFDSNSLSYLPENPLIHEKDFVALEVLEESLDLVLENLISSLTFTKIDEIFELPRRKFHEIRRDIPRNINEVNSRKGLKKKGTDAQISEKNFESLLKIYQEMAKLGVAYGLIGHFGDGHLHFNFLPNKEQVVECEKHLLDFYEKIKFLKGSPFAEHGIGILKKGFVLDFLDQTVFTVYKHLKESLDPFDQFFPEGFLNLYKDKK